MVKVQGWLKCWLEIRSTSAWLKYLDLATVHAGPHSEGFAPDAVNTCEAVTTQPSGHPEVPVDIEPVTSANPEASEAGS